MWVRYSSHGDSLADFLRVGFICGVSSEFCRIMREHVEVEMPECLDPAKMLG
jgi:hypothetical protein